MLSGFFRSILSSVPFVQLVHLLSNRQRFEICSFAAMSFNLQAGASAWSSCAEKYAQEATFFTSPQASYGIEETMKLLKASANTKLTVADIACGSGVVPINLVTKFPKEIESIVASDYAEKMCTVAEQRYEGVKKKLESEGAGPIASLKTVVADAQDLSAIPSNSVDVTFCVFGVMFVPDPKKAIAEMIRITKPGGLISIMSWLEGNRSQFMSLHGAIAKHLATKAAEEAAKAGTVTPPTTGPTGAAPFVLPFSKTEQYQTLFDEFKLKTELVATHTSPTREFESPAEFCQAMTGVAPFGLWANATPQQMKWATEFISSIFGEFSPFSLTTHSILAIGRKQ